MLYTDDQIEFLTQRVLGEIFRSTPGTHFNPPFNNTRLVNQLPADIQQYIHNDVEEDLEEMKNCAQNNLFTAASLMAFRIFEKIVFFHIEYDLKRPKPKTLFKGIELLKETFSKQFVNDQFQKFIRINRNKGMHSAKSFSKDEAFEIIDLTMWLVIFVCSIGENT